MQSESGADLGQRGRQRGCGIELLSLLGPGFSFVGLFFLLSQLWKTERGEMRSGAIWRERQEIFLRWCWLADRQREERQKERGEHVTKSLFKSQLPSENVLAPSKSLQRFWRRGSQQTPYDHPPLPWPFLTQPRNFTQWFLEWEELSPLCACISKAQL